MRRRIGMAAMIVAASIALLAGPAAAGETTFSETCPDVFGKGAVGDLEKKTNPGRDSMVAPGQTVDVSLRWPNSVVAGEREHRVMECASTNGDPAWLWADRRLVTGDGNTTLAMAVPSGVPAGSKVCGQSILVTKGSFGPVRRWSETVCYRVGAVEKKVMEPLSRRSPAPPEGETTDKDQKRKEEEKRKRDEEEKRRKEEEQKRKEEEERRKKEEEEKKVTPTTEVTLPPTTATTAPPPAVAPSPPPPRQPLAAPAAPPPKAPVTLPASQARPRGAVGAPAGQLARTGTGALGLFILGGVTLISGRLLRRAFPARRRPKVAPAPEPGDRHAEPGQNSLSAPPDSEALAPES